jgi:hypothetical protein
MNPVPPLQLTAEELLVILAMLNAAQCCAFQEYDEAFYIAACVFAEWEPAAHTLLTKLHAAIGVPEGSTLGAIRRHLGVAYTTTTKESTA